MTPLGKLQEARDFVNESVFVPALASPTLDAKTKNIVKDSSKWLPHFERIGDRLKVTAKEQQARLKVERQEKAYFWVVLDGNERGPFSIDQLTRLIGEGKISVDESVRSDETGQIIKLSSLVSPR